MVQGICATGGAYTGSSVRISDWTRFTSTPNAPRPATAASMLIAMTIGALVGVLVTSATTEMYGFVQWNPLIMLQYVQANHYTAAYRAGAFFAGCDFFGSQIFINMTQNCVSSGMEFAGTFPRFITLRHDGFIVCFIGILIQLWRFLSQATILLSIIGSFSAFVAPMTGILVADYWLIRRRKRKIPDLYFNTGIYWYFYGLNWRAFLAFCIAWAPAMHKSLPSLAL